MPSRLDAMPNPKTPRSIPHRRTRESHASETAEDYVEAVFEIIEDHGHCRVGDLAKRFGVSHVTVSRIVKRLTSEQLLETAPLQADHLDLCWYQARQKNAETTCDRIRVFAFVGSRRTDRTNRQRRYRTPRE